MSLENRFAGLGIGNGVNFSQAEKEKIVDALVEVGITASMADTYDTLKSKILAAEQTAVSITPGTSNQNIPAGIYDIGAGVVQGDADLISANIKAGKTIFGVNGDPNVVDTSAGTAAANKILLGYKAYVDGSLITGSIPSKGAQTYTPGTSNQSISAGQYLSGTQTIQGDSDLVPSNIKNGVNIFGVVGTMSAIKSIQKVDVPDTAQYVPSDVTISSVVANNTIVLMGGDVDANHENMWLNARVSSSTAVQVWGTDRPTNDVSGTLNVIEFNPGIIKSKQQVAITGRGFSQDSTFAINSVDTNKSIIMPLHYITSVQSLATVKLGFANSTTVKVLNNTIGPDSSYAGTTYFVVVEFY